MNNGLIGRAGRHALGWSLVLAAAATAAWGKDDMIKGFFYDTDKGLAYSANGWSVRSEGDHGWVSLKVGDAEFIRSIAVQKDGQYSTFFPDRGNLSHDQQVGRNGAVSDGINMLKFSPAWHKPEAEFYVGANEKQDQVIRMFLADGVTVAKSGPREIVLAQAGGATVTIRPNKDTGDVAAGLVKDPAGTNRLAVSFPCKGFAANAFTFVFPGPTNPPPCAGDFVSKARFDVKSSDDEPGKNNQFNGAAPGALNPCYGPDTRLDFSMIFTWRGEKPFNGYAELEVIHSLGQPHFYQKVDITAVTNRDVRVQFQPKFHLPGVSEVWCRLVDSENNLIWVDRYRMAYDWPHYKPAIQVEPDFKAFWDQTLAAMRAEPLDAVTERVKAFEDHPKFEIYDVTFNGWNKQRMHAMLFVPKGGARPLPAIVTAHPGTTGFGVNKRPDGVYGSELRQDSRFVTIVPLIRGHAPDAPDIPFNHPWWGPLNDRDSYVARSWYCAMVRSIDYLATRPDLVDMTRVVSKGGSQGGALALVTAALDHRVAVCLADCPANCQPSEIMENYPSFGPSAGRVPEGKTLKDVEKLLSYYNPVNFCPSIACPAYVGSNIGDLTVHSMGPLAAYHNLTGLKAGDKDFYPGFTHFHGSGPGLGVKSKEWLEKLGGPLPTKENK